MVKFTADNLDDMQIARRMIKNFGWEIAEETDEVLVIVKTNAESYPAIVADFLGAGGKMPIASNSANEFFDLGGLTRFPLDYLGFSL